MQTTNCFVPLKQKAELLVDYAHWLIDQNVQWTKYFNFDAAVIDDCLIQQEPALKAVHAVAPIKQLGLLRVNRFSMYDWHVDQYRLSCINLLISDKKTSHTLFGEQKDESNKNICELMYEPSTYYLFNNQIQHCVINLGGPRYLVSLYFETETPYEALKNLFVENKIC